MTVGHRIVAWTVWLGTLGVLGQLGYAMLTGAGKPGRPSGVVINNKTAPLALLNHPAPDFSLTLFGLTIPLALASLGGLVFPDVLALGTTLPLLFFAALLVTGASNLHAIVQRAKRFDVWRSAWSEFYLW